MKRVIILVVTILLLCQVFTLPVLAADDGGGSFWDIIDSIGGFFSDLFDTIFDAVKSVIDGIIAALKYLFIPRPDYFTKLMERFRDKLEDKFGGLLSSIIYLQERFTNLKSYPGLKDLFVLKFSNRHLFGNGKVNLLYEMDGVFSMIRGAFSGFIVLMTVAFCYRRIDAVLKT